MLSVVPITEDFQSYIAAKARHEGGLASDAPVGRCHGSIGALFNAGGTPPIYLDLLTCTPRLLGFEYSENYVANRHYAPPDLGVCYRFEAPTSWTILWATCEPQPRSLMEAAFDRAVARSVNAYIEPEIAICSCDGASANWVKLIAAQVNHATDREGNLRYHANVLFPGLAVHAGEISELRCQPFYDRWPDAKAYFALALEHESNKLGLRFCRPPHSQLERTSDIEVSGIPDQVIRLFSSVQRKNEEGGRLPQKHLLAEIAVDRCVTPSNAEIARPRGELLQTWNDQVTEHGLSRDWVRRALRDPAPINQAAEYERAREDGLANLTRQRCYFARRDIFHEVCVAAQCRGGLDPARVWAWTNRDVDRNRDLVKISLGDNVETFTTAKIVDRGVAFLRQRASEHATEPTPPSSDAERAVERHDRPLTVHPLTAVERDLVKVLSAPETRTVLTPREGAFLKSLNGEKTDYALSERSHALLNSHSPALEVSDSVENKCPEGHRLTSTVSRLQIHDMLATSARDGRLVVAETPAEARRVLLADWSKSGGLKQPANHAIIAAGHDEVRELNDLAQQERVKAHQVSRWSAVKLGNETFYRGDRVLFIRNNHELDVMNGDFGTIVGIRNSLFAPALQVSLDRDHAVRQIPLRTLCRMDYRSLRRGYAVSAHRLSGRDTDHVYCLLSSRTTNAQLSYACVFGRGRSPRLYADKFYAGPELTQLAGQASRAQPATVALSGSVERSSHTTDQAALLKPKTGAPEHQQTSHLTIKLSPGD